MRRAVVVLYLINSLGAGGAERSLVDLLPKLHRRGIHVVIACLSRSREGFETSALEEGSDVRYLQSSRVPGQVLELRRLIRSIRPDIVHTTIFEADIIGRLGAVATGVPVVTSLVNTSYDVVRYDDPNVRRWKLRAAQAIDGWTARHLVSRFHALSAAVVSANVEALGIVESRIDVIGRGRDPSRLGEPSPERKAASRAALGIDAGTPLVVTVGRQEFQKGQEHLLAAVATVFERDHRIRLLIAGRQGNASETLRHRVTALGIEEAVTFLGHRDDVPDVLAAADVFAFPSLYEGFGGAAIEAMALGLPIVASDIPALREVFDGCAALVPPGAPGALAAALESMLSERVAAERLGARARSTFLERYTLESVSDQMARFYRRVAEKGR